jgi:hypothetical protein
MEMHNYPGQFTSRISRISVLIIYRECNGEALQSCVQVQIAGGLGDVNAMSLIQEGTLRCLTPSTTLTTFTTVTSPSTTITSSSTVVIAVTSSPALQNSVNVNNTTAVPLNGGNLTTVTCPVPMNATIASLSPTQSG